MIAVVTATIANSVGLRFIGLGLGASLLWGASDFLGGIATRKTRASLVVASAHAISLVMLLLLSPTFHTAPPPARYAWLGLGAGVFGGIALMLYYHALSLGQMGLTTAVTGLLTTMVPIVFSSITEGAPKGLQIAGFVAAAAAIALIAYSPQGRALPRAFGFACLAGLTFGIFLVVLHLGSEHGVVWQLTYSRVASTSIALGSLGWTRLRSRKRVADTNEATDRNYFLWWAAGAGLLEATGTLLYMESTREGRLDVAAVLASLYPVVTLLLAVWFLKERITESQAIGVVLALGAVVLMSV